MEILSCKNVAFKYNESTDYAVSDCTFSVEKGEKIMLCGASGSGKSTWVRTEANFLTEKVQKR